MVWPFSGRKLTRRERLLKLPYYHGLIQREDTIAMLSNEGDFLIRETELMERKRNVCSVMWGERLRHYIIFENEKNKTVRLGTKEFKDIEEMVNHYTETNELVAGKNIEAPFKLLNAVKKQPWELDHKQIRIKEKIGVGEFGEVYKGTLDLQKRLPVAIKTSTREVTYEERKKFMREARFQRTYDHPNIVKFYGVAAKTEPLMIVMEFAPGGALLDKLRKQGTKMTSEIKTKYALEAARGLEYLHSQSCIHRDVAARNCLIGISDEVKISDFGLCRVAEVYKIQKERRLPIKWLAPETLKRAVYSSATDVWSFGVLMWEIYANGEEPYAELDTKTIQRQVALKGYRLKPPPTTGKGVTDLMKKCWGTSEKDRPSMTEIRSLLEKFYNN